VVDADGTAATARVRRADLVEGAGLDPDADVRTAATEAAVAAGTIAERIAALEADLARLGDLEERQGALVASRDRHQRLVDDLRPAKFPRYVLDERRRVLADLGGELFEQLSGGRYRFTDDGSFGIVDLGAAERVRPADTLSGGETFLGSLALALALAETVAREGGRLDAFFLDEGFGSLDSEHLDLAMEGVERLAAMGDRLVVVVSHVPALNERIEDLVVLDKDAITGDTRVVSGAG
jgi:exonuclease SbcC